MAAKHHKLENCMKTLDMAETQLKQEKTKLKKTDLKLRQIQFTQVKDLQREIRDKNIVIRDLQLRMDDPKSEYHTARKRTNSKLSHDFAIVDRQRVRSSRNYPTHIPIDEVEEQMEISHPNQF